MRTRQSVVRAANTTARREPAAVRAHDLRRDPPAAARAERRRATEADLRLRSRRRADDAARSRTAASRRSTSPTTTARTSGASPTGRSLNITPTWSPDARSIAYTSYRRGGAEHLHLEHLSGHARRADQGRHGGENWLPAWSPDGTRIAFSSTRDGNPEIYVVNRDGSNVRRLTNNPAIDITPTWSPTGTQIAFTSDRTRHAADLHRRRRRPRACAKMTSRVVRAIGRPGRRRRSTRSRTPRAAGPASTSRCIDLGHRPGAAADLRRRHQREPGVLAQRPPHRVHVDARRARRRSSRWPATARTCGRSPRPATTTSRTGPNDAMQSGVSQSSAIADDRSTTVRMRRAVVLIGCDRRGGVRARKAAGRAARSAAAAGSAGATRRSRRRRRPSRSRADRSCRRSRSATMRSSSASLDDLNRNSPLKPVFFELDSSDVDAAGQKALDDERGAAEAVPDAGPSRSKDTATSAAPPSTIWRWASGARSRRAPIWCRSASPPIGCGRSATARNSRSIRATTRRRSSKNRRAHFVITAK